MYDIIIKNGTVIDGTGAPAYHCDVAVSDGKIAKIARCIREGSKECIDATGLTVTPGFIDSHSHSDNAMLDFPDMIEKIEQGITTSIGGQCGSTLAPIVKNIDEKGNSDVAGYGKKSEVYKTFGTMVEIAKNIPMGSNVMSFVGHSALRKSVIGYDNRKATQNEIEEMKSLLKEAMEHGALGVSFGLIYSPGCYADMDELIELVKVVKSYDGVISAHLRDEGFELIKAVDEFLTIIKAVDVKAVFSHHKAAIRDNWGKVHHTLKMIQDAAQEGYDIYCDVYPYIASSTSLATKIIANEFRAMDNLSIAKSVADSEMRTKIKEAYVKKHGDTLSNLMVTGCAQHPEYDGLRMDEIARMRGQDHFDCAFDLLIDGNGYVRICDFSMCEEDLETVMKFDRTMICTDSSVAGENKTFHPRLKATFPRALGRYVRERNVVTLPEMIRKCTSMPASVYGLPSKGILREGFDADICIFDAELISDKATFSMPNQRCEGMCYVLLGGEIVVKNAVYNGKRKGGFIPRLR